MALRLARICSWLAALALLPGGDAAAQGAFQSSGGARTAQSYSRPALSPYRSSYSWRPYSRYQPYEETGEPQAYEQVGTVRTLCVRLCDGFYFPISSATTRSELSRDADKCTAMCSVDAQLFYHPNAGGSIDTMVDLTGRAYSSYANAFKYRHALVPGCRCRPQPWSAAEQRRHRAYGRQPVVAEAKPVVEDDSLAGASGVTDIASDRLVPRPQPIERQTQAPPPAWYPGSRRWGTSPYR